MKRVRFVLGLFGCLATFAASQSARSESTSYHLWDIVEIYSNADGSIQFIEMFNPVAGAGGDNEHLLGGHAIKTNANCFTFPNNLPSSDTDLKRFLLATSAAAALLGCPSPDFIIPANFFNVGGDTLQLRTGCGVGVQDTLTFGPGQLPTDGVNSLVCTAHPAASCTATSTAVNSPTNFAGQTGSLVLPCTGDLNGDGQVGAADLALLLGAWGPNPGHPADLNNDGNVGAADLALLLGNWGPCP